MTVESVAAVAAVAVVPMVALMLSAFVKTSVVLALLRNALGAPQAPPGLVVTGLALLVTAFVMAPVGEQVLDAVAPRSGSAPSPSPSPSSSPSPFPSSSPSPSPSPSPKTGQAGALAPAPAAASEAAAVEPLAGRELPPDGLGWSAALARAAVPVRAFLARHAHAEDRAAFLRLARELRGGDVADDDLLSLAAAFVTSELTEAFAIAFLVFLPFLVLDLVVGIGLGAAGLTTVSPAAVALPLKLILFVAVDGWRLLLEGLIRGYA